MEVLRTRGPTRDYCNTTDKTAKVKKDFHNNGQVTME